MLASPLKMTRVTSVLFAVLSWFFTSGDIAFIYMDKGYPVDEAYSVAWKQGFAIAITCFGIVWILYGLIIMFGPEKWTSSSKGTDRDEQEAKT